MIGYVILVSIIGLLFAALKAYHVRKQNPGNKVMQHLSDVIHEGALTFLKKEYRVIAVFMIVVSIILLIFLPQGYKLAIAFILGGVFSATAGNIGMRIATITNTRTANACRSSLNAGLKVAFSSGTVMGLVVVSLGLLGVSLLYLIFGDPQIIFGFGFGASSIALFARVGGGIYTKAADVGADLVGKVEAGIPEDDPRNPAVIADNVGDNVGDVAGMGADLFESYVDSLIAAMVIGIIFFNVKVGIFLPLTIAAVGIIASIIGTFFVRATGKDPQKALDRGIFISAGIMVVFAFLVIYYMAPGLGLFPATVSGLVVGVIIGLATEYYTSAQRKPAMGIALAARTGAGTGIIEGLAVGMASTVIPVLAVSAAIIVSYHFAGLFGIAIAAVGMLSTLGITLATDTYGPVADNAAGIAEMAKLGRTVRARAEKLDAVGNTTAAIGKGFAVGSAALTALALFSSYSLVVARYSGRQVLLDIVNPYVMVGLFVGAMLPFVFSSMTMRAVGTAAQHIVQEVRRQFHKIKGLMKGKAEPDYKACIGIATDAALRKMVLPSLLAVVTPILVGMWSLEALGGLLVGTIVTGFLLAVFMANAGGAWDNAKKYVESGHLGGKGSDVHRAAVVGDTVGDPFKDTSGPSLNILIKLISIVALVFVPLFI
jgi:K(+)-stimulated pyrophosphate-energized sodium pump